jgi:hypothetical protein
VFRFQSISHECFEHSSIFESFEGVWTLVTHDLRALNFKKFFFVAPGTAKV